MWDREFLASTDVSLVVCVREWMCVWLAPVDRLHDSRYSYGVLLCADAWPVWGSVCVSVRYDCVCGQTLDQDCESFCYSARFDRRCYTMHSMYLSSSGHLVLSGFSIWFLLGVNVCNLFSSCSVPLLCRKTLQWGLMIFFIGWSLMLQLNWSSKVSKTLNVDCCFLFPENIKHTLSVKVVGCMNGKHKLFSEMFNCSTLILPQVLITLQKRKKCTF